MSETVSPQVTLIAWTQFEPPADIDWTTDADGGQALAEFAGRACYQAWDKPNPATATNAGYLAHILEVGHLSVIEHATATFYLTGISRSLTHELIRHRHFSFSQLSQRYVPEPTRPWSSPTSIAADPELHKRFLAAAEASVAAYNDLLAGLEQRCRRRAERDPAPQAGPPGRAGRAPERDRDPPRRDRQLPGLAALHRDPGDRTRRRRDPRARHRMPATAADARAERFPRFRRSPPSPTAPRSPPARSSLRAETHWRRDTLS